VNRLAAISPFAAAAAYAIAYDVNRSALHVFGMRPEDLGWGRSTILEQAGALFLIIVAAVVGFTCVGVAEYRLVRDTQRRMRGTQPLGVRGWIRLVIVAVGPVGLAVVAPLAAPHGAARAVVEVVAISMVVGFWTALAVQPRLRTQGFAVGVAMMAVSGALCRNPAFHPANTGRGLQYAIFVFFGLALAHTADQPNWRRTVVILDRAGIPVGGAVFAIATTGLMRVLLIGVLLGAVAGWFAAEMTEGESWSASLTRWLPTWRRVRMLLAVALALVVAVAWTGDREEDAVRRAVQLEAGAPIKARPFDFFPIVADPVRIVPRNGDPLGLCARNLVARLLGANGGKSFVLLRPPKPGNADAAFVLPLAEADYEVARGFRTDGLCEELPP
jgi:hypothetical protein